MFISRFAIAGFRSLKNVEIKDMGRVCIFHGLNNSGKSNILAAMEVIFKRKVLVDETTGISETTTHERPGSFWQGRISDFRDNFYAHGKEDITFSVSVTFGDEELVFLRDTMAKMHASLGRAGHDKVLTLEGRIKYVDEDSADMILEDCFFNKEYAVFVVDEDGKKAFFPDVESLTAEQRLASFEQLMALLVDSFALLPANRFLTVELASHGSKEAIALSPSTFKQWLFRRSLTRAGHALFEEIKTMFASDPFSFGEIGFTEERGEIEIMVQDGSVRLPLSRLGSGHQQILYIIANLILTKKKMLGIEELEINLSPTAQKIVFEKLKKHIFGSSDLVSQVIITSHSNYFRARQDVRPYAVEHNGKETNVSDWTDARGRKFFLLTEGD